MKKICFILIVAVVLAGCATSLDGERYRSAGPSFDLFEFFNGTVRAWGLVQNRGGEVVQKFEVDIRGTVTGNRITLDETFRYAIGTGPEKRVWKIDRLDNGEYRGVADDVLGELDEERKANFKKLLPPEAQVFASGTSLPSSEEKEIWEVFQVKGGIFVKDEDGVGE